MTIVWAVLAGILVGVVAGLFGVGGGIIAIPLLVYAFKMDQRLAQGTSLAMLLPPTGLLAFLAYQREGHADLKIGLLMALGVFLGGWAGARWAQVLPVMALRRGFAVLMVVAAVQLFLEK